MIFRQLFEPASATYTYLLGCPRTRQAVLIDPALETVDRDLAVVAELGLTLAYSLETHVHADHLTSANKLKQLTGSRIAGPAADKLACRDVGVREGEVFRVGDLEIHPLFTPGHTDTHHCFVVDNGTQPMIFTGDALLIDGCGRTDFQSGDAATLYRSITEKLFTLPGETLVYPAHDYKGRHVSSIAQERQTNSRLGGGKPLTEFIRIMDELKLPKPVKIEFAVPGNQRCGICPPNVPVELREPCDVQG